MLDPEGAYFSWLIRVETDKDEDAVRQVFEFAEWDCAR
jgi:two-component system chemotaxis sensor kinase CheA